MDSYSAIFHVLLIQVDRGCITVTAVLQCCMVTAHLVPAADVPDQLEQPGPGVGVEAGGRREELGVGEVQVVQPAHRQRPQLRVQLLHLRPVAQLALVITS